jgi:monoamine oxidase
VLGRRDFLKAALAVAPYLYLSGCGGGGGSGGASASGYDTIVVGSGMAGLAAASTLEANGLRVLVLEGRDRIGGRTSTDTTTFDVPVDIGAQWFHQSPTNGLLNYAAAHGYTLMPQTYLVYDGTQPATPAQAAPALQMIETLKTEIDGAGEAAANGDSPDESAAQATLSQVGQPWYQLGEGLLGPNDVGVGFSGLSSQDHYNYDIPPTGNTMIQGGMGTFVSSFAKGLRIRLSTPVTAIQWGGRGGVKVVTAAKVFGARSAIVTTPMGGLAAGVLAFNPVLPDAYLDAIANLPMGNLEKIFLGFSRQVFDLPVNSAITPLIDEIESPFIQAPVWGGNVALSLIGADLARELTTAGPAAMIDYAQQQVADLFGNGILSYYQSGLTSNWLNDPWTLGSYSNATVGHVAARQQLAVPVGDQVFFAGEALSIEHFQTVYGAYLSGIAAADQVLTSFGLSRSEAA